MPIIFPIIYPQLIPYPHHIPPPITFPSKPLLKFPIILYPLKLNIPHILPKPCKLLLIHIILIIFSITLTLLF
ncbi:putative sulfate exporter family transporter, partial [Staphylococcus epidermidis]|uniref:putative sulfate exporter family transporter n=1 Tax=Staphylococcus epidermidis TaxID=1282 RepID=UPI0037D9B479